MANRSVGLFSFCENRSSLPKPPHPVLSWVLRIRHPSLLIISPDALTDSPLTCLLLSFMRKMQPLRRHHYFPSPLFPPTFDRFFLLHLDPDPFIGIVAFRLVDRSCSRLPSQRRVEWVAMFRNPLFPLICTLSRDCFPSSWNKFGWRVPTFFSISPLFFFPY